MQCCGRLVPAAHVCPHGDTHRCALQILSRRSSRRSKLRILRRQLPVAVSKLLQCNQLLLLQVYFMVSAVAIGLQVGFRLSWLPCVPLLRPRQSVV